jgi:hypothetical protein
VLIRITRMLCEKSLTHFFYHSIRVTKPKSGNELSNSHGQDWRAWAYYLQSLHSNSTTILQYDRMWADMVRLALVIFEMGEWKHRKGILMTYCGVLGGTGVIMYAL